MAKQTITKILDDLSGEDADESVSFALDGNLYEIDLSGDNAFELRTFLARYIEAGSRVGRVGQGAQVRGYRSVSNAQAPASAISRSNREENQAIREWANVNGYELAERGRIPMHIVDAYRDRHARAAALKKEADEAEAAGAANGKAPAKKRVPAKAAFSGEKVKA